MVERGSVAGIMRARIHQLAAAFLCLPLVAAPGRPGGARGLQDEAGGERPDPPSVLLILADDLGFSDLGCYGGEIPTPVLDGLAAEGVRFTRFHDSGRCWTTRAALLTGYQAQAVRRDRPRGIDVAPQGERPRWARLLPRLLKPSGYRSYHAGKWHLDGTPLEGGFDRSYHLEETGDHLTPAVHSEDGRALPPVTEPGWCSSTAIADFIVRCLQEHAAEHADRPFLAYVAFTAPHHPLQAEAADVEPLKGAYDAGFEAVRARRHERLAELGLVAGALPAVESGVGPEVDPDELLRVLGPGELARPVPWDQLDDTQRAFQAGKMELHAAMVARMDREIGRVLEQVRAMGAERNTLVLFLSDNGASAELELHPERHDREARPGSDDTYLCLGPAWSTVSNTPFRLHKSWVHAGGVATPLIARWPARIEDAGGLRRAFAHVVDLVPTLVELAGGELPTDVRGTPVPPPHGRSLVDVLVNGQTGPPRELWFSHDGNRALVREPFKLVATADGPWELYDLEDDPTETRDLAAQHPELVAGLRARWQRLDDTYALQAAAPEGNQRNDPRPRRLPVIGEAFELLGRTVFVIAPTGQGRRESAPWVLYTPARTEYPGLREVWLLHQLSAAGVAVAGTETGVDLGGPGDQAILDELYTMMVEDRGHDPRALLFARDEGGLEALGFAAAHPERVAALAAVTPAFDLASFPGLTLAAEELGTTVDALRKDSVRLDAAGRAAVVARAGIPALVLSDPREATFEPAAGAGLLETAYGEAGNGDALRVLTIGTGEGEVHHPWRSQELVDFLLGRTR